MKSIKELTTFHSIADTLSNQYNTNKEKMTNIKHQPVEPPYVTKLSYILLKNGNVEIEYSFGEKNATSLSQCGELFCLLHNGHMKQHTIKALQQTYADTRKKPEVDAILTAWYMLEQKLKNVPIIKPSEVCHANAMYQHRGDM